MTRPSATSRAKELMEEAGYGPDNPLDLNATSTTRPRITRRSPSRRPRCARQTRRQHDDRELRVEDPHRPMHNQDFDMARDAWCGDYNEASTFSTCTTSNSGQNNGEFFNNAVRQDHGRRQDRRRSAAAVPEAEEHVAKDVPIIPIYLYAKVFMIAEPTSRAGRITTSNRSGTSRTSTGSPSKARRSDAAPRAGVPGFHR